MTEKEHKKPGFFDRLFGRPAAEPGAAPEAPAASPEGAPVPAAAAQEPAAVPAGVSEASPEAEAALPAELAGATLQPVEAPAPVAAPAEKPSLPAEKPATPAEKPATPAGADRRSWWRRLTDGMRRTSSAIGDGVTGLFTRRKLDAATLEELEDILVQADLGIAAASRIADAVGRGRYDKEISPEEVRAILAAEVEATLLPVAHPLAIDPGRKPFVILMVGVNGAGKTTTIGKLARKFTAQGHSVMLAAGDTFRAAAIEQLKVWGERTGSPVVARPQGSDAAGLAFDALEEARQRGTDVLLVDTAGRLQNKSVLMAELEKIVRVLRKLDDSAPHAVLLVLDATVGQNAISQVELFRQTAGVTGLVMTKLDGTARGGILVALAEKFGLPVHFIGVGEGVEDLDPFTARDFARAIAGLEGEPVSR
jgi:fused signal recognition particle receptor